MNERATARGGRWLGPVLAAGVLVVGLVATGLAVNALAAGDRDSARRVMDQRTAVARSAVTVETGRYLDLLETVAAGVGTNARFTEADFAAATRPLVGADLTGATSVVFAVPTPQGKVTQTQAFWRSRGAADLTLQPKGVPQEHIFSIFARQLNDSRPPVTGLDVSSSAEAHAALNEARRTGAPTVSDTYVLLRDRDLPPDRQQLSFAFVAPVYTDPASASATPVFRGWIVMGLHGQDFLGGVLGKASQGLLDGELRATNGDGRQVRVAGYTTGGARDLLRQATFPVANRQWTLVTGADSENLPGARSDLPTAVLLGGTALTLMLAWLVYVLATGGSRARARVLVATAELREAEAEARRQAGLLGAIMASLGDGVGVIDGNGNFLLHNPAAKELLGIPLDVDGPENWQESYGLYLPDGRTPFPVEDLPLVRGLRGESSDGVEMMIRNASRPEGLLVSVDGRPLDLSAGQHGAVAVFHDITELRRYEADLSVFAGVVAHDLKAPLAVIRGHCETAGDALDLGGDADSVAEARHALARIAIAVDRMAALIDTLLAYTTSRDAPLRLTTVALDPLVAEVVGDRTSPLRPGDGPTPDIYVGPLPTVHADPAMLRHVIDNLIGNALKYVQPGRGARIDVTAAVRSPGWVGVEIADRGIGIPDDDKPNIFESFHRAQSAAGYAGTGLGLAICRRIVERHGGTIGVTDNPGGGTRFSFTLPAVPSLIELSAVPSSPATLTPATGEPAGPSASAEPAGSSTSAEAAGSSTSAEAGGSSGNPEEGGSFANAEAAGADAAPGQAPALPVAAVAAGAGAAAGGPVEGGRDTDDADPAAGAHDGDDGDDERPADDGGHRVEPAEPVPVVVRAGHPTAGPSAAERPADVAGALSRALAERTDAEQASVGSPVGATQDPGTVRVRSAVPGGRPGRPQTRSTRQDS